MIIAYEDELGQIDWKKNSLAIGLEVPGKDVPWMELSVTDLKVLYLLLNKPVIDGESAADNHPMLRKLGLFAKAAVAQAERERLSPQ